MDMTRFQQTKKLHSLEKTSSLKVDQMQTTLGICNEIHSISIQFTDNHVEVLTVIKFIS